MEMFPHLSGNQHEQTYPFGGYIEELLWFSSLLFKQFTANVVTRMLPLGKLNAISFLILKLCSLLLDDFYALV